MDTIKNISGGVCAPDGFTASGLHCGIRKNKTKKDLALIVCSVPCSAAGIYTQNLVQGAPILVTKQNIANGKAQAVLCNSGNANTCNAGGIEIAQSMCGLVEKHSGISAEDVIVASTGVIGQPLLLEPIAAGMADLIGGLSKSGSASAAEAIMTTDTFMKEIAVEFSIGGKTCRMGAIAKGSGMIHPNMATMLVFITTDVAVSPAVLKEALTQTAADTFQMLSVDGDTSTNDTCCIMASGLAGNSEITSSSGEDFNLFLTALKSVMEALCRMLARDGEGATKLVLCRVTGAETKNVARTAAKSVICSALVKTAMFGADANWGRVLCALGYSGAKLDVSKISVAFRSDAGFIDVCKNGAGIPFSEEEAKKVLSEKEITVEVDLSDGNEEATAFGCDLTYDYVKINGDYRT